MSDTQLTWAFIAEDGDSAFTNYDKRRGVLELIFKEDVWVFSSMEKLKDFAMKRGWVEVTKW